MVSLNRKQCGHLIWNKLEVKCNQNPYVTQSGKMEMKEYKHNT